jgi:phage repressor protein C with HTH and peptisase S24 domain
MGATDNSPIFDDLMRFKPESLTPNAWAVLAGVSRTVWADMRRHGNPSRRTLEKLLTAAGSSLAEFEALRIREPVGAGQADALGLSDRRPAPWGGPQLPGLPLLATSAAGTWGEPAQGIEVMQLSTAQVRDRVARPAILAHDATAYAIAVIGNSMWPRFRPGRVVAVAPALPVAPGDDVVVKLAIPWTAGASSGRILVKELVSRSERGLQLRQFNPDISFDVAAADVASIEKVLGEIF